VTIYAITLDQQEELMRILAERQDHGAYPLWKRFQLDSPKGDEDVVLRGGVIRKFEYQSGLNKDTEGSPGFHCYVEKPWEEMLARTSRFHAGGDAGVALRVFARPEAMVAVGNYGGPYLKENPIFAVVVREFWIPDDEIEGLRQQLRAEKTKRDTKYAEAIRAQQEEDRKRAEFIRNKRIHTPEVCHDLREKFFTRTA